MTMFKNIMRMTRRNRQEKETITLMKLGVSHQKDELGFAKEKYIPVQVLDGIIQAPQNLSIDYKGQESNPQYIAYLMPDFILEAEDLNDYRIKYERPHETMILKIVQYNPNLFLQHTRHHIRLQLILEKKYNG